MPLNHELAPLPKVAGPLKPLPPLPDFKDPNFKFEDVDPEQDRLISQRAAEVVRAAPQMKQIEAIRGAGQQGQGQGNMY